jgi:hypothetical protein
MFVTAFQTFVMRMGRHVCDNVSNVCVGLVKNVKRFHAFVEGISVTALKTLIHV